MPYFAIHINNSIDKYSFLLYNIVTVMKGVVAMEKKKASFSLNKSTLDQLDNYSTEKMIVKSQLVDRAIIEYIENHSK